ncbi:hypothetical protein GCM10010156_58660 [Planobispora rosea]|uniref:Resolvase/invertase-type recombinase catalytic domain-containing protein n=1 Tax=Planobispora rosea TaxID=35762 RepID=A0A8J3S2G1_PLARO|nr:recombinase family protein [Planobispora rosea]GGS92669.1 hypothetical protein GCM10010156_58660 [Planobispora rosea]GIH87236.1 hypothetical protein Pro02_56440 [Planobispora rosea]
MPRLVALGPDSPIPVVSYARISADTKKDEHGVKDQHIVNHETAARCGWTVVHQFTDNDKSASKADVVRDGFEAMLVALRKGQLPDGTPIRGVVVVADDRLARRSGDYERFVDAFTYNDGFVFADSKSVKNLYSEDVESMGMFGVVISKMEARKIQRRMRRSHQARAMQGKPVGGVRPFGWKADRLTLDPAEAPLIQKAARLHRWSFPELDRDGVAEGGRADPSGQSLASTDLEDHAGRSPVVRLASAQRGLRTGRGGQPRRRPVDSDSHPGRVARRAIDHR